MPAELFHRDVNLDLAYPRFLERLLEAKAKAKERGASYLTTELHRSMERSQALYVNFKRGGPRAAPAGASGHNFGICSDEALIVRPSPNRVIRWNPEDYTVLYEELTKVGLANGSSYNDWPHVDFPGFVTAQQLEPLLKIWNENPDLPALPRLQEVWKYLDQHT
jgi:peptidoglycan L-alanyl-D-glutamate endopeptidase CwlK